MTCSSNIRSMIELDCAAAAVQVVQMFDKAEAEYRELSDKKRILHNDKDKIHKVRAHLCSVIGVFPFPMSCTATQRYP